MESLARVIEHKLGNLENKCDRLQYEISKMVRSVRDLEEIMRETRCVSCRDKERRGSQSLATRDFEDRTSVIRSTMEEERLQQDAPLTMNGSRSLDMECNDCPGFDPVFRNGLGHISNCSIVDLRRYSELASHQDQVNDDGRPLTKTDDMSEKDDREGAPHWRMYPKEDDTLNRGVESSEHSVPRADSNGSASAVRPPSDQYLCKSSIYFPNTYSLYNKDSSSANSESDISCSLSREDGLSVGESGSDDSSSVDKGKTGKSMKRGKMRESSKAEEEYVLPEKVTAAGVIELWEKGGETFPPIRDWTAKQKFKQKSKVSRWRKLVHIFYEKYKGNLESFLQSCTDQHGQQLTVSAILNSHREDDTLETALSTTESSEEHEKVDVSINGLNGHSNGHSNGIRKDFQGQKLCYLLPRKLNGNQISALDIITLWERGVGSVPPIKMWPPIQKMKQQSKISRWRKIMKIYKSECNGDIETFKEKYTDPLGKPFSVGKIIALRRKVKSAMNSIG